MNNSWQEVTKQSPCKICGKNSWCSESDTCYICRRVSSGIEKTDKNGANYWIHKKINTSFSYNTSKLNLKSNHQNKIANEETRHIVYSFLLNTLNLDQEHLQNLHERRKIPKFEILNRNYKSLPLQGRSEIAQIVITKFGENICKEIPGLYLKDNKYWTLAGSPGIIIPVRNLAGEIIALKIRTNDNGRYIWFSSKLKAGVGPGCPIHIPLHSKPIGDTIRITEGELKADIATIYSNILTISVPGVSIWRPIIPILKQLNIKTIKIAYDNDIYSNKNVGKCFVQLCNYMDQEKYAWEVETWN